jgi:hypothetical protein
MAGNFAVYQQSPTYSEYHKQAQMPLQVQWGPKSLEEWLKFWQTSPYNTFDVGYLMNWGARCETHPRVHTPYSCWRCTERLHQRVSSCSCRMYQGCRRQVVSVDACMHSCMLFLQT